MLIITFIFCWYFRFLDFLTLSSGLETSGLSLRRPVGTKVLPNLQAKLQRNRLEPLASSNTARVALASQKATTTAREASARHLNTARLGGPRLTPTKCNPSFLSCKWHWCFYIRAIRGRWEKGFALFFRLLLRRHQSDVDKRVVKYSFWSDVL